MRAAVLSLSLVIPFLVAACGGGGGADPAAASLAKAVLGGGVAEVDGSTQAVSGVALRLRESGERVVSASDGTFRFRSPVTGDVVLELDGDGSGDDSPDSNQGDADDSIERGERCVRIRDVRDGERIDVRLRVRDGRLERVDISRGEAGSEETDQERELEVDMAQGPDADDPAMEGEVELESRIDGDAFEVEVEYAMPGRSLRVVVVDLAGAEDDLGERTVDALGEAEWERKVRDGQTLPFGVDRVDALVGFTVHVRDAATGAVLLTVEIPSLPTLPVDSGDDESDDSDEAEDDDDSDDADDDDDGEDDDDSDEDEDDDSDEDDDV